MKRIVLLIIGYYLIIQAVFGLLAGIGNPENLVLIWAVSGFFGWGGYKLIKIARRPARVLIEDSPTKDLAVPETNRLDRK